MAEARVVAAAFALALVAALVGRLADLVVFVVDISLSLWVVLVRTFSP